MLELYQFEMSHYCEKVRLILDYKGLDYRKIEVTPGVGQLELLKIAGQRQVPVLKDGDTVVSDSTEIAMYLERKYPEKPIIPSNPLEKGQCLLIESWADECLGLKGRKALIGALNHYPSFRTSILPKEVPDIFKNLLGAVPGELLDFLGTGVGLGSDALKEAKKGLEQDLQALSLILSERPYLIGNQPTLADFAVAGLSMYLRFPSGNYLDIPNDLKGKGIPGLADSDDYNTFFTWRDRIYATYRKASLNVGTGDNTPTTIDID